MLALPLNALPPLDVVLLSHNHYDHLDKAAVKWNVRREPALIRIADTPGPSEVKRKDSL